MSIGDGLGRVTDGLSSVTDGLSGWTAAGDLLQAHQGRRGNVNGRTQDSDDRVLPVVKKRSLLNKSEQPVWQAFCKPFSSRTNIETGQTASHPNAQRSSPTAGASRAALRPTCNSIISAISNSKPGYTTHTRRSSESHREPCFLATNGATSPCSGGLSPSSTGDIARSLLASSLNLIIRAS